MKNNIRLYVRVVLLAIFVLASTAGFADKQNRRLVQRDSLLVKTATLGEVPSTRMMHSAYPVKMRVIGRSLRISSKYQQTLPIYTQGGTLYLAMQLSPGVNWLNGLPRGRYRINNRTISIK